MILVINSINVFGQKSIFSSIENDYNRRESVNFLLQNRFRLKASQFYFWYEFFFTWFILVIFQIVNIQYIKNDFLNVNIPITSFAALMNLTLIINSLNRIIYNLFSEYPISWDYWTMYDCLTSLINMVNIILITSTVNPSLFGISTETVKANIIYYNRSLKYFIALVVSINWIRAVIFFYCLRGTSSLLVTLVLMIKSTLNFLIIISGYLLITTTLFYFIFYSTEDSNADPRNFNTFTLTLNFLFDAMVSNFNHPNFSLNNDYDIINRVLLIIHIFISNVLLLNYLVAVLMVVFNYVMIEPAEKEFNLRNSVYYFSRRYDAAMHDEYYGNLILIQPPLNFLLIFSLPLFWFKDLLKSFQYYMGIFYFIITSSGIVLFVIIYLLIISPIVSFKIFFINFSTNKTNQEKFLEALILIFFGYFIVLYHVFYDIYKLIIILTKNYNLLIENKEENNIQNSDINLKIYKELMKLFRNIYLIAIMNRDQITDSLIIKKKHLMNIILKNKIDLVTYNSLNGYTDSKEVKDLVLDIRILSKKIPYKKNLYKFFINSKKKGNMEEDVLKINNNEIFEKFESMINCFVIKDHKSDDHLDLFIMKNLILSKKLRPAQLEKILMISYPIITSSIEDMQNKNIYGMIEYFDSFLSRDNYKKINEKVEIIERLLLEIPSVREVENKKNEENQSQFEEKINPSVDKNSNIIENISSVIKFEQVIKITESKTEEKIILSENKNFVEEKILLKEK